MKFNKWTLGLAALGVVSLASAVKADETKAAPIFVDTAVNGTTISGYVGTSAEWNFNNNIASRNGAYYYQQNSKHDGFALDAVEVTISKPLDEGEWAAGYNFTMVYGQDANTVGVNLDNYSSYYGGSSATIKDAYVELRAPVGNGIDIKAGVWDTILGYEGFDRGNNPNYTYSYGYGLEPTTYAGILASYQFAGWITAQAGVANNPGTGYYSSFYQNPLTSSGTDSRKTYLGGVALTAPQSWGVLAGSTLNAAVAFGGFGGSGGYYTGYTAQDVVNYYVGTVVNTGVKGLTAGASYDYMGTQQNYYNASAPNYSTWANAIALYSSFQATDKLLLSGRAEYEWNSNPGNATSAVYALTATATYDLWKNVLSRLEVRWDHNKDGVYTESLYKNSVLVAANLIYKF